MHPSTLSFAVAFATLLHLGAEVSAVEPLVDTRALLKQIGDSDLMTVSIGRTSDNQTIPAILHAEDLDLYSKKCRILLIADSRAGSQSIHRALSWFYQANAGHRFRQQFVVSGLPHMSPGNAVAKQYRFPPAGKFYQSETAVEYQFTWRWLGMHAPDLVVYVHPGNTNRRWFYPHQIAAQLVGQSPSTHPPSSHDQLVVALGKQAPCDVGTIPALRVTTAGKGNADFLSELLTQLAKAPERPPSPARQALQARMARSPQKIAKQLSASYGQRLRQVTYIPTLALLGRIRLGELTDDATHRQAVNALAAPYVLGQTQTSTSNGSSLAGHLLFTELAKRTPRGPEHTRLVHLARGAAATGFTSTGELRESMPHHNEMSDAVFMGGPLLAELGYLTGEAKYFDMALRHIRFIRQRCRREDGLYRHSPLDDTAWGRGNGFPALGLALCLSHWPETRHDHRQLLTMFQEHMSALKEHQDRTGCWHQIIDRPNSYREFTCTCMITFALARGISRGWLAADEFDTSIRQAWPAIQARIAPSGELVNVCTGTGKQRSEEAYHHRTAILGHDDRGGAMALMVCTELAEYLATPP